jgi:hypothetical protein
MNSISRVTPVFGCVTSPIASASPSVRPTASSAGSLTPERDVQLGDLLALVGD